MTKKRAATKPAGPSPLKTRTRAAKLKKSMATKTSLVTHLNKIKITAAARAAAGGEKGACLVSDPQTGENRCIRTDPATCKSLRGVFLGGPCGG